MEQEGVGLIECIAQIPDPRKRRGIRHPFVGLVAIAILGLMCRQVDMRAIVDHCVGHWREIGPRLGFKPWFGVPHPTTMSRVLAKIPLDLLQAGYRRWLCGVIADAELVVAVDGKYPHQSRDEAGLPFGMLTAFAHDLKVCLAEWVVSDHEAEPSVLKAHLEELLAAYPNIRALTLDAIFAQRGLCQMLVDLKVGYMLRIKGNQPNVVAALVETFADAPQRNPDAQGTDKVGGRVETRRLWLDTEVADYAATELSFAGAQQAGRLDKTVLELATGEITHETWYLMSHDPAGLLSPAAFLGRARGHWAIENSLHHVEDRSWYEDKHTLRRPGLGPRFSALLHVALTVLRCRGALNPSLSMPRRAKRCGDDPTLALALLN